MLWNAWSILCESALFILVGFAIAGLLKTLVSGQWVIRLLSGARMRSVFLATLIGVPLPLCSCSVLPTALTLRKKGAGRGATLSFLISTPETSVTSVLLTYSLLGPLMAVFRPMAACVTAFVAGLTENALEKWRPRRDRDGNLGSAAGGDRDGNLGPARAAGCDSKGCGGVSAGAADEAGPWWSRCRAGWRYAFRDLFDDIFGWIVLGIVAAAALQAWMGPELLNRILGGQLQSMLLMVLIGVPLYVCAEASTPVAAVLIAQGVNPGAALVLLLVGPATNLGAVGVLYRQLGRRTVIVYLTTIIVVALVMGAVLNGLLRGSPSSLTTRVLDEPLAPSWLKVIAAVTFLALGIGSVRRLGVVQRSARWLQRGRVPFEANESGGHALRTATAAKNVSPKSDTPRPDHSPRSTLSPQRKTE